MYLRRALLFLVVLLPPGLMGGRAQDSAARTLKSMARDADPNFEVATIKPATPDDRNQGYDLKGNRISIRTSNVTSLICFAYKIHKSQIVNAPRWFDEQPWNIEGIPDVEGTPNWNQYRRMLQKLLATRFGLRTHPDKRELSVYALTVAKGGPKLEKSKSDPEALSDQSGHGIGSQQFMKYTNVSMADFAPTMQLMVDRPLLDQTNLTGRYDFTLLWMPDVLRATEVDPAPALFTAVQEQLGLKLTGTKALADVMIVDAATRPSEN
jgi:uncharacterized protein (TIGR03435 family)